LYRFIEKEHPLVASLFRELMQEGKKETEKPTDFFELEFKESNC
jgi:hypothetical protein